jgi:phage terminase large subunit
MERVVRLSDVVGSGYGEFWRNRQRYRVLIGGRASKKSTTASLWTIANMMKYPESNTLVIRKVYKDHKDSTYAQLKWAIRDLGVEHLWDARLAPLEIVYRPTGQKILFRGLDDPMSITSITVEHGFLCWVWFEEFFQVASEADFDMIDGSVRGEMPPHLWKQITGTMNPWNEKHWIKARFFDKPDPSVFTLRTDYTCNEFLDEADRQFFEDMKVKNPRRYQVEGLGNWGVAEGLIFDKWAEKDFDPQEVIKKVEGIQSAFGLDFGYTVDPTGFVGLLVDEKGRRIWLFEEHYQRGMLNSDIADMLRHKGRAKELIVADSAEPKSIDELKKLGIARVRPARKGKDSIANGIQFLQQFEIIVHPSCTNAILELNNYAWDTKNGKLTNVPIDGYNHIIDPMRYAMERFLVKSNISFLSNKAA